jgi:hypothetical protein
LTVPSDGTTPDVAACPGGGDPLATVDDVALNAYRKLTASRAVVAKVRHLLCKVGRPLSPQCAQLVEDFGVRMELPSFIVEKRLPGGLSSAERGSVVDRMKLGRGVFWSFRSQVVEKVTSLSSLVKELR